MDDIKTSSNERDTNLKDPVYSSELPRIPPPEAKASDPSPANEQVEGGGVNGSQPPPGSIFPSQDFTNPYIALVPKFNQRERSKSKDNADSKDVATLDDLV